MPRRMTFTCRTVLNPAKYESLEFCHAEELTTDETDPARLVRIRRHLASVVKQRVEEEVLEAREIIRRAQASAERDGRRR